MIDILLIVFAGFITGLITVLLGFGGGFVVVPLVYQITVVQPELTHYAMHIAIATSTAVMVFNSGWASYQNWRSGGLPVGLFPLTAFIAAGALLGSLCAGLLQDKAIRGFFIVYMVITLGDCLVRKGFFTPPQKHRLTVAVSCFGGSGIGLIAALLGVGGSVVT